MYVMHKEGLNSPEWNIVKKLKENLMAKIHTKYEETRAINIKDSVTWRSPNSGTVCTANGRNKQGNKQTQPSDMHTRPRRDHRLPAMDGWCGPDHIRPKITPKMLDTTDNKAWRYHIEFGKSKIFEKVMYERLVDFLNEHKIIFQYQLLSEKIIPPN